MLDFGQRSVLMVEFKFKASLSSYNNGSRSVSGGQRGVSWMVALTQQLRVQHWVGVGGGAEDRRYVTPASYTMQPGSFSNHPPPASAGDAPDLR